MCIKNALDVKKNKRKNKVFANIITALTLTPPTILGMSIFFIHFFFIHIFRFNDNSSFYVYQEFFFIFSYIEQDIE